MKADNAIPFLDLVAPHRELEEELVAGFRDCLRQAHFIGGAVLENFEREFAAFCDAKFCVGAANGTDALRFALMASGVVAGDVVVTVANTFIATAEAITQAGAHPAFVDVDERTYNMDPACLREFLEQQCYPDQLAGRLIHRTSGRRVSAVVPVHLYGQMADMDAILELAERYGLTVIEDSCQGHGASYYSERTKRWHKAGSMGVAAAFSFYPGKNLGACGEAGAVTTNDEAVASKIRMLREHGQSRKYHHEIEGYNGRLDTVQAGILSTKLKHLAEWNAKRRKAAANYQRLLDGTPDLVLPHEPKWSQAVYHLYVVRVPHRGELQESLAARGVGTGIHYPIPLHLQNAYRRLGHRPGDFPVSERVAPEILSLPMFPQLGLEQQERVVDAILDFVANHSRPDLAVGVR